jgi:hypothetical protein
MGSFEIKKSRIPVSSGAKGSLSLNIRTDPSGTIRAGARSIVDATFDVDGNQDISCAHTCTVAIGIYAGSHTGILPIFQEKVSDGAEPVKRLSVPRQNCIRIDLTPM